MNNSLFIFKTFLEKAAHTKEMLDFLERMKNQIEATKIATFS